MISEGRVVLSTVLCRMILTFLLLQLVDGRIKAAVIVFLTLLELLTIELTSSWQDTEKFALRMLSSSSASSHSAIIALSSWKWCDSSLSIELVLSCLICRRGMPTLESLSLSSSSWRMTCSLFARWCAIESQSSTVTTVFDCLGVSSWRDSGEEENSLILSLDIVVTWGGRRVSYDFCNIKVNLGWCVDDRRCRSIVSVDNIIGAAVVGVCGRIVCFVLAKSVVDIFLEERAWWRMCCCWCIWHPSSSWGRGPGRLSKLLDWKKIEVLELWWG